MKRGLEEFISDELLTGLVNATAADVESQMDQIDQKFSPQLLVVCLDTKSRDFGHVGVDLGELADSGPNNNFPVAEACFAAGINFVRQYKTSRFPVSILLVAYGLYYFGNDEYTAKKINDGLSASDYSVESLMSECMTVMCMSPDKRVTGRVLELGKDASGAYQIVDRQDLPVLSDDDIGDRSSVPLAAFYAGVQLALGAVLSSGDYDHDEVDVGRIVASIEESEKKGEELSDAAKMLRASVNLKGGADAARRFSDN